MKNLVKHFGTRGRVLCTIVPAAVMIFVLAACANGTTEKDDDPLVISGTLSRVGGSPSIVSRLSVGEPSRAVVPEAGTQTFRVELGSDNKTLSGKLKDGSITFELKGQYDASTKVFSVQAPSSTMIFSLVGKLNAANTIDQTQTSASVKVKDGEEWTTIDLTVTPSDQTVEGTVNADMTGVTYIPAYCRGMLTDQILDALRYMVTENSITMYDGNYPPLDFTVVNITNTGGSPADENGPWDLIVRGKWRIQDETLKDYTGKFYVSKTFDSKLTAAIGDRLMSDLYFGDYEDSTPLSAAPQFSGIKMVVAPYCANSGDILTGAENNKVFPHDGYSPLFISTTSATANAKAATELKAKSGFVLALK